MKKKILYVYEKRIPIDLRKLIISSIKKQGYLCDSMNYQTPKSTQKNFLKPMLSLCSWKTYRYRDT